MFRRSAAGIVAAAFIEPAATTAAYQMALEARKALRLQCLRIGRCGITEQGKIASD
ncbi:MAG TPA: hypothetical protein VIL86_11770 [Tepidisphaeraceae bacterium]|jgi:hypothetical protein